MAAGERVTYRAVLRNREFAAILVSQALSIFGDQVARIALAVLVFERTGSALAASATYGVAFISYMVAGPMLSTLADRYPRRTIMVAADVGRAVVVAVLAIGGLPLPAVFALITLQGVLAPAFDSARSASLPQILLGDAYVKGSALYNIAFQGTQVVGFLAGGALLTSFSVSRVLAFDAGTYLISAGAILGVLLARPSATEPASSRGMVHDTLAGVRVVWYDSTLRRLLAFSLLGAAVVAAPEGLAIPVASELGGASLAAGILTASIPAGFVVGTLLVLSVPSHRRVRLLPVLTALSAVPLVATPLFSDVAQVAALWAVSGMGAALQVVSSAAYIQAAPPDARGRAYGLASTSIMGTQGFAQLLTGAGASVIGDPRGSRIAVSALAVLVLALLAPLWRGAAVGSRSSWAGVPQGIGETVR